MRPDPSENRGPQDPTVWFGIGCLGCLGSCVFLVLAFVAMVNCVDVGLSHCGSNSNIYILLLLLSAAAAVSGFVMAFVERRR